MAEKGHLLKHKEVYHTGATSAIEYLSPYRFITIEGKLVCPLGCPITTTCARTVRKHMVNDHTLEQLSPWGYNRDLLYREYLLLLEKADIDVEAVNDYSSLIGKKR